MKARDKNGHKYFDDLYGKLANGASVQFSPAICALKEEDFMKRVMPHTEEAARKFVAWEGRQPNVKENATLIIYGAVAAGLARLGKKGRR